MPEFSQFVSFKDNGFTVPPHRQVTDRQEHGIPHMPDLNRDRDAVLMFKMQTIRGSGKLLIQINDFEFPEPIKFGPSDSVGPRVWYETISGERLHKVHNKIVLDVVADVDPDADGEGKVKHSVGKVKLTDFKIFYHAQTAG
jgi:hypothetical protein